MRLQNDRPVRDCQHTQAHHKHGTRLAYVLDRCRCPACSRANTLDARRRRTAIAYGRWTGLVDAAPARAHLQALRAAGLSLQRIARLSGVGQGTVNALVYGQPARHLPPPSQVRAGTERRLLAVDARAVTLPAGHRVPATGTRRRLQALAAIGWSIPALSEQLALSHRTLTRLLTATDSPSVTVETTRTVADLYERLRDVPPPQRTEQQRTVAARTAGHARAAEGRTPTSWPDIDRDPDTQNNLTGVDNHTNPHDHVVPAAADRPGTQPDTNGDELADEELAGNELYGWPLVDDVGSSGR